jgi:putative tryptophan/tyrosine transport system substrate-binding protein
MRRREFIAIIGGAAAVWSSKLHGQQPEMPVVGFLNGGSPDSYAHHVAALRQGLSDAGYIEGQNVAIEYRWAKGEFGLLPALATDLVNRRVAVVVTSGSLAAQAAKSASGTIPIVFNVSDPVGQGLAASLNRPGGNATGVNVLAVELEPKRLELLRELVPRVASIAILVNPSTPLAALQVKQLQGAARATGLQLETLRASRQDELDTAFAGYLQRRPDAMVVAADPFFNDRRDRLVALAAKHAVPTIYEWREFVDAGGLMSYGANLKDTYRQLGVYAGRILKGAKPADLPIEQPTKFELVINLKTAKALGLVIPPTLLARADEVIE